MKNNLPVFGIITVILVVFRILLNSNPQLVFVVASINLVALLIVVFAITNRAKTTIAEKITQSGVPKDIEIREKKHFRRCIDCWTYIPLAIIYISYLFCFSSKPQFCCQCYFECLLFSLSKAIGSLSATCCQ